MSGSRWVISPWWLTWRTFLYSSSVYSCHLFLVSSVSVRFIKFLSFIVPIFAWTGPLLCIIFLKRSLVSHAIVFLYFFALISEAFLSLLAILWKSAFRWVCLPFPHLPLACLFSQPFLRPPQTTILPFCISFSWQWSWSLPLVQCHEPLSTVLQALHQI